MLSINDWTLSLLFGLEAAVAIGLPVITPPRGRDWDIYEDIEARLLALEEFDAVEIGRFGCCKGSPRSVC